MNEYTTTQKVHLLIGSEVKNKKEFAKELDIVRLTFERRLKKKNWGKLETQKIDELFEELYDKK